ncbi:glycosyltransferase family 4 protein [Marinilactibacillus sp. XAAS-LB27]|uniref:glycosyltransferase family 4 protein n=1 Tax=Marinilactibacillus sp. XAAS-LB27 TaxID=3114538 RepID=UPI002E185749|nr:glycosyltransferase family 4 protein [Marinilactibacillus sp. XAAS-LB27]
MKKVLMLASVASMIDLFNKDNILTLQELGTEVQVACNFDFGSITSSERVEEFKKELTSLGIKYYNVPIPRSILDFKNILKSFLAIEKIINDNNFELLHCHSPIGGAISRLAASKYRSSGLKVIYTAHGFHFFKGASLFNWLTYYSIERYLARKTDVIITINQEDYRNALKFPNPQIKYVPGIGIETENYSNKILDTSDLKKELAISTDEFVLISVGQLSKRKNHEIVIRALAKINDKKMKYVIVGLGELEEKLTSLAKELNISEQVLLLGYRSDIKELLNISDCFVFPSLQEGLPVALMEAMASGLPISCSKIRGNVDLIEPSVNGYFFKPDSLEEVIESLDKIKISDRSQIKNNNHTKSLQYDKKIVKKEMEIVYSKMLNEEIKEQI